MRIGRVWTAHTRIEPRQHDLLGIDLGEGPTRRALIFGAGAYALWILVMLPLVGVPNRFTFSLYFLPPAIFVMLGVRPAKLARRIRITQWVLMLRYALAGHRPVIRLGARRPRRAELLPLSARWHGVAPVLTRLGPTRVTAPWEGPVRTGIDQQQPSGPTVELAQATTVTSGDRFHQTMHTRKARR